MIAGRTVFALALALAAGAASAQIYRWTDEKGKVHITDTPPPPGAKNVQKHRPPSAPQAGDSDPYVLQLARKNAPVTLYTTPGCEPCGAARNLLNARGVPFKEVSVVDDQQIEELKRAVGANAVPSLIVGSTVHQGIEERAYHAILDAAGYPKVGVLPPRAQEEPKAPQAEEAPPPAAEAAPTGPYAPGAPRQRMQKKPAR
jgi:glutaredoxin